MGTNEMNGIPSTTRKTSHKKYRENWTLSGLVGSLAVLSTLFALLAAPIFVVAVAIGAVSAHLIERSMTPSSQTPATHAHTTRRT